MTPTHAEGNEKMRPSLFSLSLSLSHLALFFPLKKVVSDILKKNKKKRIKSDIVEKDFFFVSYHFQPDIDRRLGFNCDITRSFFFHPIVLKGLSEIVATPSCLRAIATK
jgi:hypothetical protein